MEFSSPESYHRLVATSKRDLLQHTLSAYLLRSSALRKVVPLLLRKINSWHVLGRIPAALMRAQGFPIILYDLFHVNVSIAVRTPRPEAERGGKGYFSLPVPSHAPSWREDRAGIQGRNAEAGTETEAVRVGASWLAPHSFPRLLSYTAQNHKPRDDGDSELGPPTSVVNQENALQTCLQAI